MSAVLLATTPGAVTGPMLVTPVGEVAHSWGVPRLAGPFLLAAAAFTATAVVLACLPRPDPLRLAQALTARAAGAPDEGADSGEEEKKKKKNVAGTDGPSARAPAPAGRHDVAVGTTVMILTQVVMIGIMTMTPVHMLAHGHGARAAGLVISLHVGAMFLPSPLTGLLVDRICGRWVACASGPLLPAAGALAALSPAGSAPLSYSSARAGTSGWSAAPRSSPTSCPRTGAPRPRGWWMWASRPPERSEAWRRAWSSRGTATRHRP